MAAVVDAGEDDLCDELDSWGEVGVVGAAVDLDAIDAVLVDGLQRRRLVDGRSGELVREKRHRIL